MNEFLTKMREKKEHFRKFLNFKHIKFKCIEKSACRCIYVKNGIIEKFISILLSVQSRKNKNM